ncbi:MAG: hypothetical protein WD512_12835 [Candidatus Paceibacterota bacterium]
MKKLNRKDFKKIHDIACEDWKGKLIDWYGSKFAVEDTVEIKDKEYSIMRNACTDEQSQLFDKIFGKELDITDKVKTLDDAIKLLGERDEEVVELRLLQKAESKNIPFQSLVVIIKALNEGWTPDWNDNDEYKYYPWFDMSKNVPSYCHCNYYYSGSDVASRLCFKNSKIAEYCVKHFIDLYVDYMK